MYHKWGVGIFILCFPKTRIIVGLSKEKAATFGAAEVLFAPLAFPNARADFLVPRWSPKKKKQKKLAHAAPRRHWFLPCEYNPHPTNHSSNSE